MGCAGVPAPGGQRKGGSGIEWVKRIAEQGLRTTTHLDPWLALDSWRSWLSWLPLQGDWGQKPPPPKKES